VVKPGLLINGLSVDDDGGPVWFFEAGKTFADFVALTQPEKGGEHL